MPHDVFISYSSHDRTVADAACAALEAGGIHCWIAPRDVVPGEDYPSALVRAIHESKALVLILSSHSNGSSQVARELERAASRSIPILPFRIEAVEPSPSVEFFISRTHWLDALTPRLEEHLERLLGTVKALLAGERPKSALDTVGPGENEAARDREVRYCTANDGVRIAYCVEGDGNPLVVLPYFVESFSLDHLVPPLLAYYRRLGQGRRLVRMDVRGTGLSQRDVDDVSYHTLLADLEAFVAAASLKRFALLGQLNSCRHAIEYAARHPEHVTHLILFYGYHRVYRPESDAVLRAFAELARTNWPVAALAFTDQTDRRQLTEFNARLAELFTRSASGEMVAKLMLDHIGIDVSVMLPSVRARTLVLNELQNERIPFEIAQEMAAGIPDARLVALPESGPEDPINLKRVAEIVTVFLSEEQRGRAPSVRKTQHSVREG